MKLLSLVLLFTAPGAAMACPHSRTQFMCPGDAIVDSVDREGTVTAVNPFQHSVSYRTTYGSTLSADMTTLALKEGCLEAFCVNDGVVDSVGREGTVIAVNPYSGTVAYRTDYGSLLSADTSTLNVKYGCALGYCVADGIVDSVGRAGTIIALSPYGDRATYRTAYGSVLSAAIETLSSTEYCQQYGDAERGYQHYPALPSNNYAAPDFRYYHNR